MNFPQICFWSHNSCWCRNYPCDMECALAIKCTRIMGNIVCYPLCEGMYHETCFSVGAFISSNDSWLDVWSLSLGHNIHIPGKIIHLIAIWSQIHEPFQPHLQVEQVGSQNLVLMHAIVPVQLLTLHSHYTRWCFPRPNFLVSSAIG